MSTSSLGDKLSARAFIIQVVLALLAVIFLPPIYSLLKVLLAPASWASKTIPGPPYGHFIWGHMKEFCEYYDPFEL